MDKTAFDNMDFSEYMSDMSKAISVECNKAIVKRLLNDVIDIYNNRFLWYGDYKESMLRENTSALDYSFDYNKYDSKINFVYIPKHIILEEFAFDYIRALSKKGE
jgi:hypothetical protein